MMLDASLLLLKYRSESYDGDRFHQYCQNRVRRGMQQLASPKKQQGLVAQASLGKHVDMKQFWLEGVLCNSGPAERQHYPSRDSRKDAGKHHTI